MGVNIWPMDRPLLERGRRLLRTPLYRRYGLGDGLRLRQIIRGDRARRGKRLLVHWYAVFAKIRFLNYQAKVNQ